MELHGGVVEWLDEIFATTTGSHVSNLEQVGATPEMRA